jgi:hypothetical protein
MGRSTLVSRRPTCDRVCASFNGAGLPRLIGGRSVRSAVFHYLSASGFRTMIAARQAPGTAVFDHLEPRLKLLTDDLLWWAGALHAARHNQVVSSV